MKIKEHKGITLIALVVTIVVLLILAGVTISMLRGENGIIKQAQKANDATIVGKEKEAISIAYSNAKGKKISSGQTSTVTASELQTEMINNKENVKVEGTGKLKITFNETGHEYEIDENEIVTRTDSGSGSGSGTGTGGSDTGDSSLNGMYSTGGITEADIAPEGIFDYKILNNSSTVADTSNSVLPTKTAKIIRIKPEYYIYNLDDKGNHLDGDTNYEIKNTTITNKLVIPYVVSLTNPDTGEKENYKITEVSFVGQYYSTCLPSVETIVYPNTVTKIYNKGDEKIDESLSHRTVDEFIGIDHGVKNVILSDNIEVIPYNFFRTRDNGDYKGIEQIHLPEKLKQIGDYAFAGCSNLKTIVDLSNVNKLGKGVFAGWQENQKIKVGYKRGESAPTSWDSSWAAGYYDYETPPNIDIMYSNDSNY